MPLFASNPRITARSRAPWRALTFALAFIACPATALADVLQIDGDGGVTTYNQTFVITSDRRVPITPSRRAPRRGPSSAMRAIFERAGGQAGVSPELIQAVAWAESRFDQSARSEAGAIGVMQLIPGTAAHLRVNPYDTAQNISGGAQYLRELLDTFDGDLTRSLAAYNCGARAVIRRGGVPPYAETRAYVEAIMDRLAEQVSEVQP